MLARSARAFARLARTQPAQPIRNFRSAAAPLQFRIGDTMPNFQADTTKGKIDFHEWIGDDWAAIFSHPADFTPVCSSELAAAETLVPEFEKRGVKLIALSVDSVKKHRRWEKDVVELASKSGSDLSYPIIADEDRSISTQYEMLDPEAKDADDGLPLTVRSVFLIDNNKKMRLQLVYPISTGRSWPEVLRAIDSIKLAERHPVATPHGWTPGGEVVVSPSISTEKAREMYPEINVVKPYLRLIPQPKD